MNPRPPSSIGRSKARGPATGAMLAQNSSGDSNYSEENDFEDDTGDAAAEAKLASLRKAMAAESRTANKVVTKANIQVKKTAEDSAAKPTLRMGPMVGKGGRDMEQVAREVNQMQPSNGLQSLNQKRF